MLAKKLLSVAIVTIGFSNFSYGTDEYPFEFNFGNETVKLTETIQLGKNYSPKAPLDIWSYARHIWVDGTTLEVKKKSQDPYRDLNDALIHQLKQTYGETLGYTTWVDVQEYLIACAKQLQGGKLNKEFDYTHLITQENPQFQKIKQNVEELKGFTLHQGKDVQTWTKAKEAPYQVFGFLTELYDRAQYRQKIDVNYTNFFKYFFTLGIGSQDTLPNICENAENALKKLLLNPNEGKIATGSQRTATLKGIMTLARKIAIDGEFHSNDSEAINNELLVKYSNYYDVDPKSINLDNAKDRHKLVCVLTSFIAGYFYRNYQNDLLSEESKGITIETLSQIVNNYFPNKNLGRYISKLLEEILGQKELKDLIDFPFIDLSHSSIDAEVSDSDNKSEKIRLLDSEEKDTDDEKGNEFVDHLIKGGVTNNWHEQNSTIGTLTLGAVCNLAALPVNKIMGGMLNEYGANRLASTLSKKFVNDISSLWNKNKPGFFFEKLGAAFIIDELKPLLEKKLKEGETVSTTEKKMPNEKEKKEIEEFLKAIKSKKKVANFMYHFIKSLTNYYLEHPLGSYDEESFMYGKKLPIIN